MPGEFSLERDEQYDSEYSDSPVPDSEIRRLEIALGLDFPSSYRNFLSVYNGGSFKECIFPDSRIGPLIVVSFFSVDGANADRLHAVFQNMGGFLPASCVPFADDPGGNIFFIDTADHGRVYFWDHETRERNFLSEGFEEFVHNLKPDA